MSIHQIIRTRLKGECVVANSSIYSIGRLLIQDEEFLGSTIGELRSHELDMIKSGKQAIGENFEGQALVLISRVLENLTYRGKSYGILNELHSFHTSKSFEESCSLIIQSLLQRLKISVDLQDITNAISKSAHNTFTIMDDWQNERGIGLYLKASKFNHSCRPNAVHYFSAEGNISIRTISSIYQGQELCISYEECNCSTWVRREILMKNWSFYCHCVRCCSSEPYDTFCCHNCANLLDISVLESLLFLAHMDGSIYCLHTEELLNLQEISSKTLHKFHKFLVELSIPKGPIIESLIKAFILQFLIENGSYVYTDASSLILVSLHFQQQNLPSKYSSAMKNTVCDACGTTTDIYDCLVSLAHVFHNSDIANEDRKKNKNTHYATATVSAVSTLMKSYTLLSKFIHIRHFTNFLVLEDIVNSLNSDIVTSCNILHQSLFNADINWENVLFFQIMKTRFESNKNHFISIWKNMMLIVAQYLTYCKRLVEILGQIFPFFHPKVVIITYDILKSWIYIVKHCSTDLDLLSESFLNGSLLKERASEVYRICECVYGKTHLTENLFFFLSNF